MFIYVMDWWRSLPVDTTPLVRCCAIYFIFWQYFWETSGGTMGPSYSKSETSFHIYSSLLSSLFLHSSSVFMTPLILAVPMHRCWGPLVQEFHISCSHAHWVVVILFARRNSLCFRRNFDYIKLNYRLCDLCWIVYGLQ